ncbi:MAG: hypothetical protein ABI647_09545 [Gemmatimonadota bacterium]
MSRAFVKEDSDAPPPRYPLPPVDDPGFSLAAAQALLSGANAGDSASAEEATGYRWGDPRLVGEITRLRDEAIKREDDRTEMLADRFLRAAGAA